MWLRGTLRAGTIDRRGSLRAPILFSPFKLSACRGYKTSTGLTASCPILIYASMEDGMTKQPTLKLSGSDGNAFAVMAKVRKVARGAGWPDDKIEKVLEEMKSGDYENLLSVAWKYFNVC